MPTGCFFRLISIPDLDATSHFLFQDDEDIPEEEQDGFTMGEIQPSANFTNPVYETMFQVRFCKNKKVQMVASGLNSGSNNPTLCKPHSASSALTNTLPFSAGANDHLGYKEVQNFHFRRSRRVFFEAVNRLPSEELSSTLTQTRFTLKSNHTSPKVIHMKISYGSSSQMHLTQSRKLISAMQPNR